MFRKAWLYRCFAAVALLLSVAAEIDGATIDGITFRDRITAGDRVLTLRGTARLTYLLMIDAYAGAFYLEEGVEVERRLESVGRRLVLHYFREIAAEDFARATTAMIQENVSPERFAAMEPRVEQLNALYRDVQPGDEYSATYLPGRGTELALNGKRLGVVPGAEFSAAFFSIWIGENPIDESFREDLLGK